MENNRLNLPQERNNGIDFLKYVCCFLIILIHVDLPVGTENFILPITRMAVPIFFIITGYFYTETCNKGKEKKQLLKIFRLALIANALHLAFGIFKVIMAGESLLLYFKGFLNAKTIIDFLVFNQPPYRTSLWYINALLYALVLIFVLKKLGIRSAKFLYPLIPVLLLANLVLGTYSSVLFGEGISLCYSRNFLLCALPYVLIGDFIYTHKKSIKDKPVTLGAFVFFFGILSVCEVHLLDGKGRLSNSDHLIATFFLSVSIFLFALSF